MASKKYPQITENRNGWSDWISPRMHGYKMACCDCGLVHKLKFEVWEIVSESKTGDKSLKKVKNKKLQVLFKASRDNRATGQIRRWQK